MERPPKFTLLDERGRPFSPHIQEELTRLTPRLLRRFPALSDEALLISALETSARKIAKRERKSGPIDQLQAYAWVTLHNTATAHLRRGRGRLAQKLFDSDQSGESLDGVPSQIGTPEQIERDILWREVIGHLSRDERHVCTLKKLGFTSEEIAEYRGGTASAVNTLLSRARDKIRRLVGGRSDIARRDDAADRSKNSTGPAQRDRDDESPDGE